MTKVLLKSGIVAFYASPISMLILLFSPLSTRLPSAPLLLAGAYVLVLFLMMAVRCRNCQRRVVAPEALTGSKFGFQYLPLSVADICPNCGQRPL